MKKILLVEQENGEGRVISSLLKRRGFHVIDAGYDVFAEQAPAPDASVDLVIAAVSERDQFRWLAEVRKNTPQAPVIVISLREGECRVSGSIVNGVCASLRGSPLRVAGKEGLMRELDRQIRIVLCMDCADRGKDWIASKVA